MQIVTNQNQKELKQHGSEGFPFLVSYESLSRYESGSFQWHWHPEIEITYIHSGQIHYQVNQSSFHLKEGDIIFANANALHTGSMEHQQDCEYISITFSPKLISGFSHSLLELNYIEPIIHNFSMPALYIDGSKDWHASFAAVVKDIIASNEKKAPLYEFEIVIGLQKLWKLLYTENFSHSNSNAPAHDQLAYQRIREIISYIERHYAEPITLHDIATEVHLCESECSRLFKRYMKVPLFSFLQDYRIERSLEYLKNHESLITIAEKVGFSDSNYYSKVFKKRKGCSPKHYRKIYNEC